jgi:hypothetical protein
MAHTMSLMGWPPMTAAHHRAGREGPREILRAARAEKLDRVGVCRCQHLAGGGERGHSIEGLGVFLEIEVETFGPGCALDEPVESLRRVRDLLRDGHHAFRGRNPESASSRTLVERSKKSWLASNWLA